MIEEEVKQATCRVFAKGESATGWLVSSDLVLTAYHCVDNTTADGENITVRFGVGASAIDQTATLESFDLDLDVCLLRLQKPSACRPIPIDLGIPRPGERWYAFGYPAVKLDLGHVLQGAVQQALIERVHGVDLDLSVEPGFDLSDYRGMSGSALMADTRCLGMLRISLDKSIGAVSIAEMERYLHSNGLLPEDSTQSDEAYSVASRPDFDVLFESGIVNLGGGYLLLDGAHGIGKSTYCRNFAPESHGVEVLGIYAFSEGNRGSTPAHQAQPEIFFDWVHSLLSLRATGKPARLAERSYAQLIQSTNEVLQSLANRCSKAGKVGLLFIDGINEAASVAGDGLKRFIDLLPPTVPDGLVIVVTGAGLDALADKLGGIAKGAERLTLPALDRDAQQKFCYSTLRRELASPRLVASLCDRAKGHPLYLRYLVDLVNEGASDEDIAAIPTFSGAIQDYYESIWSQLLVDSDTVNLLGIIARLRWGVPMSDVMPVLTASESAAFIPTLARIRHLLSSPDKTEIYHPSFSEFVVHKTSTLSKWVHGRLADFCLLSASGNYGVLNKVYHGLLGDVQRQSNAVNDCQQPWVDQSVMLGAEPDILLADIEDALAISTLSGTAVDIVRLLLLSQRLRFRYNTLFAQSAELVANALIALGQTEQALRHIVRYGHLIVGPDDAFVVVRSLIKAKKLSEANGVLEKVDRELVNVLSRKEQGRIEFLSVASHRLHAFALVNLAGGDAPSFNFFRGIVEGVLLNPDNNFSREEQQSVLQHLLGNMLGSALCLEGKYRPIEQLNLPPDADHRQLLLSLLSALEHAESHARNHGIRLQKEKVDLLLSDIASKLDSSLSPEDRKFSNIDLLIMVGASPSLVKAYADGVALNAVKISLFTKSRAIPDDSACDDSFKRLRASYFLGEQNIQPVPQTPVAENWESAVESIVRGVAWCDGIARRAKATSDLKALEEVQGYLKNTLLPCFAISLSSRIHWKGSYSIPETIIPLLYARLVTLCLDCLPDEAINILEVVRDAFGGQLGLYNEGFRRSLQAVVCQYIESDVSGQTADMTFDLLCRWRDYVRENVQNRYELVPELLHMVPMFTRMGSMDEARKTYQSVLSASMGPGWYKEDQLTLMSNVLEALPPNAVIPSQALSQIAAYLERASGEMTFQRYVRADKCTFIGELCRRQLYSDAVRYFKHQSCGTTGELFDQASEGNLDRVSPLVGMRFPGGALEEQASLLKLLEHIGNQADWRLRWALLEVYQHGDERHLTDWGQAYAGIIQELATRPTDLTWAENRIRIISQSMNSERAWMLLRALVHALPSSASGGLSALLNGVKADLSLPQIAQLESGFGLRREHDDKVKKAVVAFDSKANAEDEDEDDRLFMPGTLGRRSAVRAAECALEVAQTHVKRRNSSMAVQSCISALKALQEGGWSIWTRNHSASAADHLIQQSIPSADEVARLYGTLALEERNVQRWSIAHHLINLTGAKLESAQQSLMLSVAIDHVGEMVGKAPLEAFSYIGTAGPVTASDAILELLLWTLDHPNWERRDSAAAMVLWLLRSSDAWLVGLVHLAVSMDPRNRADIASASLDILSRENPSALWLRIAPYIDANKVAEECRHAGRYATLLRIAERAIKQNVASAANVVESLRAKIAENVLATTGAKSVNPPDYLSPSLFGIWRDLGKLGVLTHAVVQTIESELSEACSPLDISDAKELEQLVAEGFRESTCFPTGRWAAKVRYALHVALFPPPSAVDLFKIDAVLRTYNPNPLTETPNGRLIMSDLVESILAGTERNYRPSDKQLVYLDFQCCIELNRNVVHVELVSQLVPPGYHPKARQPTESTFSSTEIPHLGRGDQLIVCGRVKPVVAYFGALTPAIATPQFLQLLGTSSSATVRSHWRDGRTVKSQASSRRYEASLLAIEREAFNLPPGWNILWTLRVDGEIRTVLNNY